MEPLPLFADTASSQHALFPTGTKWEEISAVPRGEEEDFTE